MSTTNTPTQPEHPCPECGGDTTRIRDRFPFTTHGTRAYLRLLVGVICVGYGVALLLVSNFGHQTTNHAALASPNANAGPIPYAPPVEAGSATLHELSTAAEGNEESLAVIRSQLQGALRGENPYSAIQNVERVRLEAHNPATNINTIYGYSMLGRHAHHTQLRKVSNPRTRSPAFPDATGQGITYLTFWPGFHLQISDPGGVQRTYSVNYFTVFGIFTLLVLLSLAISRCTPRRWGRKRVRRIALGVLLVGSVLTALLTREGSEFNMPTYALPITHGPWIDADRVRGALDDDGALRALLKEMRVGVDVPATTPAAVVVGREYRNTPPDPALPRAITTKWRGWWVLGQGTIDIISVRTARFDADRTPEQRRAAHRTPFWDHFYDYGRARFELHRARSTTSFDFNLPHTLLVLGIPWWVWLVLSRTHSIRTRRVQLKRVNRGQCIFCAYPLSPEALRARSERSGS